LVITLAKRRVGEREFTFLEILVTPAGVDLVDLVA
jgi:hypothetical protein